jgi:hypothetical protein
MDGKQINIIYEDAGTIMLQARTNEGPLSTSPDDVYVANKRIVKSISISASKEMEDIESGNSAYPVDKRARKVTGTVEVTLNAFDRQLHRFALGMDKETVTENATFPMVGMEYEVPSKDTYKIVLPYEVDSIIAIKEFSTGDTIAETTEETVTAGTYKFNTEENSIEFFSDMAGKKVTISYNAKAKEVSSDIMYATPVDRTYQLTTMGKAAVLKGPKGSKYQATIFDSVKFTGNIKVPDKTNTVGDWTVTLEMVEPYGEKAMVNKYIEKEDLTVFEG